MEKSLTVDSVLHSFGERTILTDVYLKCVPGDIIALFGWNGSGKSTLFNIIFGTLKGDRSFVRINGKTLTGNAFRSGQLAYLPQTDFLPKNMTVRKVVKLYLPDDTTFFDDMDFWLLDDSKIGELSGGEVRYLEIKLLLSHPAPYLLLDEPFNGLSPITAEKVRREILRCSEKKGIILTDHNFREVHKVANRFLLLEDGYIREIKEIEKLTPYGYFEKL